MKLAGLTRKQIRLRLGERNDPVNDRFVDLLLEGGFDDTNDVPYWRWKEMIAEAKLSSGQPETSKT